MTLQNGLIHNGKAYLWADTLAYHPDHKTALGHTTKTFRDESGTWVFIDSGDRPGRCPEFVAQTIVNKEPRTERQLIDACTDALKALESEHGLSQRLLLAFMCPDKGARMFLIAGEDLPFASAFEPYEVIQYMSYGAEFEGKPCDPETPEQMRQFIDWQKGLPNPSPLGGCLIETEISFAGGIQQRRIHNYFGGSPKGDTPRIDLSLYT